MRQKFFQHLAQQTEELKESGLYKAERIIASPQQAVIRLQDGREAINLCANNYLGLSNNPDLVKAAQKAVHDHGFGMSSVRFICGTQDVHKELEKRLSHFLGMEDTILYSSCFDANGGLFETILSEEDAVISDSLNHASIIDGIRLCKAKRLRYQQQRYARSGREAHRSKRRPFSAHRNRWRLFHGRHHRQPESDLRSGRQV